MKAKDIAGQVFGRLTVLRQEGPPAKSGRGASWRCRCSCGREVLQSGTLLRAGRIKSCGQHAREPRPSRVRASTAPEAWSPYRVTCALRRQWENAVVRPEGVCARWWALPAFLHDLRESYPRGMALRPVDESRPLGPDNTQWLTKQQEQMLWG